jgi:hypothetical protein
MKNWIIRMADPMPFGLTFLLAIVRAIDAASLVNVPSGGKVDTVFTRRTHLLSRGLARRFDAPRAFGDLRLRVDMVNSGWWRVQLPSSPKTSERRGVARRALRTGSQ